MNISKKRKFPWVVMIAVVPGLILMFVAGLWMFISATATPLHPDPQSAPSVTRATPPPRWVDAVQQGERIARAALAEQNLPGLSVAVGASCDIVWAEGLGWADLDNRTKVTPDTRFRVGDASRALTAAAVGLLVEQGSMKLDDDIRTYVSEYPKKPWPITVRQLMSQTAGVTTDDGDEAWLEPCERTADGLKLFDRQALLFEPGTQYRVSSYGWILVSAAVEAAAHDPFFDVMRARVFEPLGMADTVPDTSGTETVLNLPTFYFPRFAGDTRYGPESAREGDHSCYAGASGFLATPSDLVRFGMAVSGDALLQPATVTLLQTPQRLRSGEEIAYGLGWELETVEVAGQPTRMAGHGTQQDFIGGTTYLLTLPERGIVVAVMSNTSFADAKSVALKIAQAFAPHR